MMNMILPGLWMVDYVPDWFLAPDTHGDYSLSPKRAPDSSWHLPRGLTEEPRPCQCRAQEEVRDAEGSPLMNSGGRAKLDCEDDAWDRRGVNPDGHPGSPLPAPLQDRLRRPAAREHQEVRQMSSPPVRERELQLTTTPARCRCPPRTCLPSSGWWTRPRGATWTSASPPPCRLGGAV